MKIRPVGAELFQADGRTDGRTDRQTDMTKLIAAFRNFSKGPKNSEAHSD
jgi:Fe-S-cluster formation regulator IscX/YfhJ